MAAIEQKSRRRVVEVTDELRSKVQAWADAHEITQRVAVENLLERGMAANGDAPSAAPAKPDAGQALAHAMRELGTAHTILTLLLRVMAEQPATRTDMLAALDQLRFACTALEDTVDSLPLDRLG